METKDSGRWDSETWDVGLGDSGKWEAGTWEAETWGRAGTREEAFYYDRVQNSHNAQKKSKQTSLLAGQKHATFYTLV